MKLEYLVNLIMYMILASGAMLLMWDDIEILILRFQLRHRLRALKIEKKELPQPFRYIEQLINVSFPKDQHKRYFVISEGLLFIISYLLCYKNYNLILAFMISIVAVALPLLLLATKLEENRAKASHEGISLVTELYRQYRINKLNMSEAIGKTIESDGDYKLSNKRLYILLIKLRSYANQGELKSIIDDFAFSYGTSWAKMLGQCIKLSVENGSDVSAGLADIAQQLKAANTLEEKRRMLNGEASRMTLLLVPFMYAVCIIVAIFYLDMSPKTLFMNQFLHPIGFMLFLINIFLFLVNLLVIAVINSGKLDF